MKNNFQIRDISKILNIPTSVLRFWESKGLVSVKKAPNHYRQYTLRELIQIADIAFFRSLGLPVSTIQKMSGFSIQEYSDTLTAAEQDIERQIRQLQSRQIRLARKNKMLREVLPTNYQDFSFEEIPFSRVFPFSYMESHKTMRYLEDTSVYVRYWDTDDLSTETRGIIIESGTNEQALWKKRGETRWCTFLIKEIAELDYESNVREKLAIVKGRYQTGVMLAQFIVTACEQGMHVDYLKAYVEILRDL